MSNERSPAPAWYRASTLSERRPAPVTSSAPLDTVPDWIEELERAYPPSAEDGASERWSAPAGVDWHGFLMVIEPLLRQVIARLEREAAPYLEAVEGRSLDGLLPSLLSTLAPRLLTMVGRTLVLEMHVARLQEELSGDTPEERFRSFLKRLDDPAVVRNLMHEYPVLPRQVLQALNQAIDFAVEFLRHLCEDRPLLVRTFADGNDPGPLLHVEWGRGDRHHCGRAVLIAHFRSGLCLVYKPKPMAVEVHFHQLLAWLNERGAEPGFRTLRVIDRGQHGWVEFVRGEPCRSVAEVRRFYQRQGAYLAVLYLLAGTDCHHDNLIAAGEHPVLTDLEALFHRRPPGVHVDAVRLGLQNSVLAIRLLPQLYFVPGAEQPVDFSGLGSTAGQPSPYGIPIWEHNATDEMRWTRRPGTLITPRSRPVVDGAEADLKGYAADISAGFDSLYQLLRQHQGELIARVASFARDEVRFIPRPTQAYALLGAQALHPDRLRDGLERDRFFDRLWADTENFPALTRLIEVERRELHRGDVPLFRTRPESRDLFSSDGERIADFFEISGLEHSRQRLDRLGDDDRIRQQWVIRTTLGLLPGGRQPAVVRRPAEPAGPWQLLAAARAVGEHLRALAWVRGEEAGWAGLIPAGSRGWSIGPIRLDLAEGLPGVVLFLAYLAKVTGEISFEESARAGVRGIYRQLEEEPPTEPALRSGLLYLFTHLGSLWNDYALLARAHTLAMGDPAERSQCLAALVCLHKATSSSDPLDAAIEGAKYLLDNEISVPEEGPIGPATPAALLELSRLTRSPQFRAAASQDLERGLSEASKSKPSLSHTRAALQVLRQTANPQLRSEVQAVLTEVLRTPTTTNHSLGHGELGWVDVLLEAATVLSDSPRWLHESRSLAGQILAGAAAGWQCASPSGAEVPGLGSGLAGIGLALLRLAEPTRVPALCLLAPPPGSLRLRTAVDLGSRQTLSPVMGG
jgi:type 2 lantibiotic biosynthesis protein LanM